MTAALLAALLYPLDHPPRVTATFGAYRLTHHHAGLDLGTSGDDTVKVLAADAGRVYRIRRSHNGYGRAAYIRHADGRITVYGHMSAFAPRLAALIRAAETRTGKYRIDRRIDLPVARGESLGWVGTAGTDLVHLHFELRDGDAVNPLTGGLEIPDTRAPRIVTLLARPRAPDAHVSGGFDDAFLPFVSGKLAAPLVVGGDYVLLVDVRDRIDGSPRDLRPYEIELHIDGKLRHHTRYERVSYGDKHHIELDADPELRASGRGVFHRLYREDVPLRVHRRTRRSFRDLKPGDHPTEIIARDAAGNTSRATFTLRVASPDPPCAVTRARPKADPVEVRRVWRGGVLAVAVPGLCDDPRVELTVSRRRVRPTVTRLGGAPALAFRVPSDADARVRLTWPGGAVRILAHGMANEATFQDGPLRVEVGEEARIRPYATEIRSEPAHPPAGLEALTPLLRFADGWQPARGGTAVGIRPPKGARLDGVAIYLEDGGKWWRLGAARRGGRLWGSTLHVTSFALLRDVEAPHIRAPEIQEHPGGRRIVIPIEERDVSDFELLVDDVRVLPEWQRAWKRLVYRPWSSLTPGEHTMLVRVVDRAGWTSEAGFDFRWRRSTTAPPAARSK